MFILRGCRPLPDSEFRQRAEPSQLNRSYNLVDVARHLRWDKLLCEWAKEESLDVSSSTSKIKAARVGRRVLIPVTELEKLVKPGAVSGTGRKKA
jgi:hypothetical protein